MLDVRLEYCIDGYNEKTEKVDSFESLIVRLNEIKNEAATDIKVIFSVDIVNDDMGRLSIGLNDKSIVTYTSADYEETLTSLGDELAEGKTTYYFGDHSLMSNKYIISYKDALNVLETWITTGTLSREIKWTNELFS